MKTYKNRQKRRGFTLMEILLVLVILVVLGSMVGLAIGPARKRALIDSTKTQLNLFKNALDQYYTDVGSYPQSLDGLTGRPNDAKASAKWRGPYLQGTVPNDPWGNEYTFDPSGKISSSGPDGLAGTDDDVAVTFSE